MTIPESVQLLGVTVPITVGESKKANNKMMGLASYATKSIEVYTVCHGKATSQSSNEHTFFHELLHQVLNSAGYGEINDDEQFVDVVSGLLHQALGPYMK